MRSAVALWRVQGYDDTTVADICRAAGVSKGLFYFYFERKEDILRELGLLSTEALVRVAHERLDRDYEVMDVVRAVLVSLERSMRPNPRALVVQSILEGYRRQLRLSELAGHETGEGVDESLLLFRELFERAVADGKLGAHVDPVRVAGIAQIFFNEGVRCWGIGLYAGRSLVDDVSEQIEMLITGAEHMAAPPSTKGEQK